MVETLRLRTQLTMNRFDDPMIPEHESFLEQWSDDERQQFMLDRARLLKKLLSDRQSWQDAFERLGRRGTLKITWTDSDHAMITVADPVPEDETVDATALQGRGEVAAAASATDR